MRDGVEGFVVPTGDVAAMARRLAGVDRGRLARMGTAAHAAARTKLNLKTQAAEYDGVIRALAAGPKLLIADEPVSALDLSVPAQILNLLADLRDRLRLSLILISHDLTVVRQMTERILILEKGRCVESGATEEVLSHPVHATTPALLDAVPALLR